MQTLIYLVIALSLLIVIHEFGHFWVARRCGVKVLRFSIGFGQPLWKKLGADGTEYVIAPILLGGYVKMLDEREGTVPSGQEERCFNRQSLLKRAAIVAAGPVANLLFAFVAFWILLVVGVSGLKPVIGQVQPQSIAAQAGFNSGEQIIAVAGTGTPILRSVVEQLSSVAEHGGTVDVLIETANKQIRRQITLPELGLEKSVTVLQKLGIEPLRPVLVPVIGEVTEGQAADLAGIQPGDKIISVGQKRIADWSQWAKLIRASAGTTLEISLLRQGNLQSILLTPQTNENGEGVIGASLDVSAIVVPDELKAELRYAPLPAVSYALRQVLNSSIRTLKGLGGMLVGTVSTDNLGGLISIAQIAKSSAEQGFGSFINFMAMISIILAVLNLLPIPVLDGGHLALFFIEWIKGSPVNEAVQIQGQRIGLILLISLMLLAFYNDLTRIL